MALNPSLHLGTRPSYFNNSKYYAQRPVESISYKMIRGKVLVPEIDTGSFLDVLRKKSGIGFDLPTSLQWEHTCRAGTLTDFNNGCNCTNEYSDANMSKLGRYDANAKTNSMKNDSDLSLGTAMVGSYLPNAWGFYDMHGNVNEWCRDGWGKYGQYFVTRGGGVLSHAIECSSWYLFRTHYGYGMESYYDNEKSKTTGFRLSCEDGKCCSLSFKVEDGECHVSSIPYMQGTFVELPTAKRSGYVFDGWATAENTPTTYCSGRTVVDVSSLVGGVMNLYALWTRASVYEVIYEPGAYGLGSSTAVQKIQRENLTLESVLFSRPGYTQTGWSIIDGGAKTYDLGAPYTVDAPVTLYPYWTANTVTYHPGAYGVGSEQTVTRTQVEDLKLSDALFTRVGYTQTGWALSDGGPKIYELGVSCGVDVSLDLYPYWTKDGVHVYLSNVGAFSGYPWKEVVIGYTITGMVDQPITVEIFAKDNVSGEMYACKTLEGLDCTVGSHVVKWDASTDGAKFVSDDVVFTVRIVPTPPLYCVIDLSTGTSNSDYPVMELFNRPTDGWTDEFRTTKMVLRRVEAGAFKMQNQYDVKLTQPFYIGVFEVTQKQYELVMGTNPSDMKGDMRPVETVSYDKIRGSRAGEAWPVDDMVDKDSFLGRLRARTSLNFDLPTEAQWEYACRAGTTSDYNNGGKSKDDLKKLGWYYDEDSRLDSDGKVIGTVKVGSYLPNAWGLYDMHGNVWEWCLDWSGSLDVATDPKGSDSGSYRVVRGGCWDSFAGYCTSFYRNECPSWWGDYHYGFRISRTLQSDDGHGDIEFGEGVLAAASSVKVSVDTTFEDGEKLLSPMPVSYGGVNGLGCCITANNVEIRDDTGSGTQDWSPTFVGEYKFSYVCGSATMVSMVSVIGISHTITYVNLQGATHTNPGSYQEGTVVSFAAPSERVGYTFVGWTPSAITADMTGAKTIRANWKANAYQIVYSANGGSGAMTDEPMTYDAEKALTACAFTRKGYTFAGWATSVDGVVKYADGASVKNLATSGMVTLYAQWTPNSYVVDFNPGQGGEGSMSDQPMTYDEEEALYLNLFHRTGYTFLGWTDDENELEEVLYYDGVVVSNLTDEVDGEFDLYAVWAANTYTVKFNANGGTGTMADQAFLYDEEQELRANAFARTGYTFAGWAVGEGADSTVLGEGEVVGNLTTEADGVVMLYAKWSANPYTVRFDANGGEGTMGDLDCTYGTGKDLPACAFTRTGYTFAGWAKSAGGAVEYADRANVTDVAASAMVTLYAKWAPITYLMKFNANGGSGSMENELMTYDVEKALVACAFTKTGYTFSGWATGEDGEVVYANGQAVKNLTTTANGVISIYAKWTVNEYTVVFDANGGQGTMAEQTFVYDVEQVLRTNGFTRTGYTFVGWYVAAPRSEDAAGTVGDGTVVIVKKVNLAFCLWVTADGKAVEVRGVNSGTSGEALLPRWIAGRPVALGSGAKFGVDAEEVKKLLSGLFAEYLPNEVAVSQSGKKWGVADGAKAGKLVLDKTTGGLDLQKSKITANTAGLKLSYKEKNGTFTGSFKAYNLENGKIKAYTASVTGVLIGEKGYGTATIKKVGTVEVVISNVAVDLPGAAQEPVTPGDPNGGVQLWENGPYWAECNVGATKPEECGYYFWWGDTVGCRWSSERQYYVAIDGPRFDFDEENCPTFGKSFSQLRSKGYIDEAGNLVAAHDAATAHLGAPWRMPTYAEFSALISNCDTEWTSRNGVSGRLVKGRGAYASKSIFLPAAGSAVSAGKPLVGLYGDYWTSTQDSVHSDNGSGFCSSTNLFHYHPIADSVSPRLG